MINWSILIATKYCRLYEKAIKKSYMLEGREELHNKLLTITNNFDLVIMNFILFFLLFKFQMILLVFFFFFSFVFFSLLFICLSWGFCL